MYFILVHNGEQQNQSWRSLNIIYMSVSHNFISYPTCGHVAHICRFCYRYQEHLFKCTSAPSQMRESMSVICLAFFRCKVVGVFALLVFLGNLIHKFLSPTPQTFPWEHFCWEISELHVSPTWMNWLTAGSSVSGHQLTPLNRLGFIFRKAFIYLSTGMLDSLQLVNLKY